PLALVLQVHGDQAIHHVTLALANLGHVDRDRTCPRTKCVCAPRQIRDLGTPYLVLAGEAIDVGAGSADPSALHDGGAPAGPCQVPRQILSAFSAAKDEGLYPFRFSHGDLAT